MEQLTYYSPTVNNADRQMALNNDRIMRVGSGGLSSSALLRLDSVIRQLTNMNKADATGIASILSKFPSASTAAGLPAIALPLVVHLFRSSNDENYASNILRSFIFSLMPECQSATPVMHLSRLNAKMREDHETMVRRLETHKGLLPQNIATRGAEYLGLVFADPINVGRKRSHIVSNQEMHSLDPRYALHSMRNFLKHIRFLGYAQVSSEFDLRRVNQPGVSSSSAAALSIQTRGLVSDMPNIWGDVHVGDYLYFHITRVNTLNGSKPDLTMKDFGPLQIVPVRTCTRNHPWGLGSSIHSLVAKTPGMSGSVGAFSLNPIARAVQNHGVRDEDVQSKAKCPLFARIGETDERYFCNTVPIRTDIHDSTTPVSAAHWGPEFTTLTYTDHTGKKNTETLLSAVLVPNEVYYVGTVLREPRYSAIKPDYDTRRSILNDKSGAKWFSRLGRMVVQLDVAA